MKYLTLITGLFVAVAAHGQCKDGEVKRVYLVEECVRVTPGQLTGGGGSVNSIIEMFDYIINGLGEDQLQELLENAPPTLKPDFEYLIDLEGRSPVVMDNISTSTLIDDTQQVDIEGAKTLLEQINSSVSAFENAQKIEKRTNQLMKQLDRGAGGFQ